MSTFVPRPTPRPTASVLAAGLLSLVVMAGCATPPPADDPDAVAEFKQTNDPLEPMNRAIFDFNMAVDRAVIKPVAEAYRDHVPEYGRDRVRDMVRNLRAPLTFANDVLQGEPDRAMQTLMRFTFNTGFGAFGLFDLAGAGGIPYHEEDLGQTFAVWGVGEGPYLVLPILGPSNPRDTAGMAVEWVADPIDYGFSRAGASWASYGRGALSGIDKREANLDTLDEIERTSVDFYSALRSLYRQHREAEIKNQANPVPSPSLGGLSGHVTQISEEKN
jgi:phospholipid-binding lipoprotein MlaA